MQQPFWSKPFAEQEKTMSLRGYESRKVVEHEIAVSNTPRLVHYR
jgi:hypothetical protein